MPTAEHRHGDAVKADVFDSWMHPSRTGRPLAVSQHPSNLPCGSANAQHGAVDAVHTSVDRSQCSADSLYDSVDSSHSSAAPWRYSTNRLHLSADSARLFSAPSPPSSATQDHSANPPHASLDGAYPSLDSADASMQSPHSSQDVSNSSPHPWPSLAYSRGISVEMSHSSMTSMNSFTESSHGSIDALLACKQSWDSIAEPWASCSDPLHSFKKVTLHSADRPYISPEFRGTELLRLFHSAFLNSQLIHQLIEGRTTDTEFQGCGGDTASVFAQSSSNHLRLQPFAGFL